MKSRSHIADLATSGRLQRLYKYMLKCKKPRSTLQIAIGTSVLAVNSAMHELRMNGIAIPSAKRVDGVYYYWINRGEEK